MLRLDIGLVIHEMGHFFGLFHTFGAGNVVSGQCLVTDELPNGSNSLIAGDLIADTPAGPCGLDCNIQGKGSATVNDYCEYVATGDLLGLIH
ncbi:MAG: hypothetical protein IPN86_21085 [Saprospiraceae bacterium]|nr:hypothetical protein [Saprospiraceae bacterium]